MKFSKKSKYAFTILELIFVIIVAGILAVTIVSSFNRNNLREVADQLISHIRYTQHLAMIDEKFDTNDHNWFKSRWQIHFYKNLGSDNKWSYIIFSDFKNNHTGNPDKDEIAKNPDDPNRYLTGGTSGSGIFHYDNNETTKELNIGNKYGVKDIKFSNGCRNNVKYISFDYFGRPFNSFPANAPYEIPSIGYHVLLTKKCIITLCTVNNCSTASNNEKIKIAIEPWSGYAHIL